MVLATYLGERDGEAYMRISSMSWINPKKWSQRTVCVNISELDEKFRDSLPKKEMTEE
jgi:hypothetical protein